MSKRRHWFAMSRIDQAEVHPPGWISIPTGCPETRLFLAHCNVPEHRLPSVRMRRAATRKEVGGVIYSHCHQGCLHLLPTLPTAWSNGKVSGLRGRGGFTVDMAWQDGKLTNAKIYSALGGVCRLRTDVRITTVHRDGQPVRLSRIGGDMFEFESVAGGEYSLSSL